MERMVRYAGLFGTSSGRRPKGKVLSDVPCQFAERLEVIILRQLGRVRGSCP